MKASDKRLVKAIALINKAIKQIDRIQGDTPVTAKYLEGDIGHLRRVEAILQSRIGRPLPKPRVMTHYRNSIDSKSLSKIFKKNL